MASGNGEPLRPDWLSKSLAGVLLGLALAFGVSALLSLALTPLAPSSRNQLVMWSVVPVWMGVLGGCFLFRTGLRAWLWLGGTAALFWGVFLFLRQR
ncbi:hypothetical protein [Corallococcus sp. RDP092CA]|uniref:hypothetical protein n=1 Tax=Corallococcus sp. RDP092CA TaxID=3109369 RepID=UPI0035AE003A